MPGALPKLTHLANRGSELESDFLSEEQVYKEKPIHWCPGEHYQDGRDTMGSI